MGNIGEVKRILGEFHLALEHIDDPYITEISGTYTDKLIDKYAQQICQRFPPYQDALWSGEEGQCFWCNSPTHWLDICYEGYVCSAKCQQEIAQDVKCKVCEYDPQAAEFGWFLAQGWLPPEEAKKKDAETLNLREWIKVYKGLLDYLEARCQESLSNRNKEEIVFLDGILSMPFFEFCLLIKERKQALKKREGVE